MTVALSVDKRQEGVLSYDCKHMENQQPPKGATMNTTKEAQEPLTLSSQEAAAMIPMGINQFRAAVRRGEIPHVKLGTKIRIPRRRFLDFINGEEES